MEYEQDAAYMVAQKYQNTHHMTYEDGVQFTGGDPDQLDESDELFTDRPLIRRQPSIAQQKEIKDVDEADYQLIFPIKNFFLMGSPLGMFVTTYFEENYVRDKLPTVDSFYNLYHPSDMIAYRLEPLIRRHHYEKIEKKETAKLKKLLEK